jgi:hypothetical protein
MENLENLNGEYLGTWDTGGSMMLKKRVDMQAAKV